MPTQTTYLYITPANQQLYQDMELHSYKVVLPYI